MKLIRKRLLIPMLWAAIIFFMLNDPGLKVEAAGEQTILDIAKGNITIDNETVSGYDSSGKLITTANMSGYCIIQSNNTTKTKKVITVKGGSVNITLQGVNIDPSKCAFSINPGASVNLILVGTNILSSYDHGGLEVPQGAAVVIDGKGSLTANGYGGAGIGGANNIVYNNLGNCGMVTIKGGTITANGSYGAGIGGGIGGTGGVVTIMGGTVNATSTSSGAGIGGGFTASGGEVIITGGTVIANGDAAGIGGGATGNGGKVKIYGGTVIAKSNVSGAGIGGGDGEGSDGKGGHGEEVFISGGNVTATGCEGGAGIGGGNKGNGGKVTISGGIVTATGSEGTVTVGNVTSKGSGAGIGGGYRRNGADVIISGGTVIPSHSSSAPGYSIGSGLSGLAGTTVITGGLIKCSDRNEVQGLVTDASLREERLIKIRLSGQFQKGDVLYFHLNNGSCIQTRLDSDDTSLYVWCPIESKNRITVWDAYWAADSMTFSVDNKGNTTYNGVQDYQTVLLQVMTTLFLSSSNIVLSNDPKEFYGLSFDEDKRPVNPAGYIIVSDDPNETKNTITVKDGSQNILLCDIKAHPISGSPITICSGAELNITLIENNTLTGDAGSAGIQLTNVAGQALSKVFIHGNGTLTANGGTGGAGIGGSEGNSNGEITIVGGRINATGGTGGAGIGSGSGNTNTSGCEIKILGGNVNATGKGGGAGIGGGDSKGDTNKGSGNKVSITGGTINAMGSDGGAGIGIGKGSYSTSGETKIIGGSVHVSSITGPITNTSGKGLQPVKIPVPDITDPTLVNFLSIDKGLQSYGTTDMYTDAGGVIFLWLPEKAASNVGTYADIIVKSQLYRDYHKIIYPAIVSKPNVFKMDPSSVMGVKSTYTYGENINPVATGSAGPYHFMGNDTITGTMYTSSTPPANIGNYTCVTRSNDFYYQGTLYPFIIKPKDISSGYVLTFDKGTIYEYTGKAITPSIIVKDAGGKILDPMNYDVSFSNNVSCALATDTTPPTIIITGKGNYGGSIITPFTIERIPTIKMEFIDGNTDWVKSKTAQVDVIMGSSEITKIIMIYCDTKTDITSNFVNTNGIILGEFGMGAIKRGTITFTNSGIYTIAVTDKVGYTATYDQKVTYVDSFEPVISIQPGSDIPVQSDKVKIAVNTGKSNIKSLTVSYGTGTDKKIDTLEPDSSDTDPNKNQFIYYYTVKAAIPYTFTATSNSGVTKTTIYTPTNIDTAKNTVKAITEFSVASSIGVIEESSHKIAVTVPYGTNIANLIAQFTQTGLSIKVGTVEQVSGKTPNNFTNPVIYTVTAEDGTKQDYTVTVMIEEEKEVNFTEVAALITKAQGYMTNGITYTTTSLQALTTAITNASKLTKDSGQDIIKNDVAALISAINKLVVSTAGITLAAEPSNSGTLVGAGNYVTDNIVTITAKPVSGYKFLGWYIGTDVSGTAFTTASSFTYTIQATDTNVIFSAKYESNAEQKLSVKIGSGTVDYSYNSMSGTWDADVLNQAFSKGTYITLSAKTNGSTFLYWLNADTNRVVSNQMNYSFNISEDMSLIACYKTTVDTHMVIFKDMNGRILKTEEVMDGGAASAPEPGYFTGYTFSGWDRDYLVVKTDLTVTAQYVKVGEYVLTVSGGAIAVSGGAIEIDPQTYAKGDFVTVIADESKDGKYFSGWYNGDMLVSGKNQFSFYITENTFLTAKYEGGTLLHEQPIVTMTMSGRTTLSNGKQSILSTVRWSVPQDYEVLSVGVIFTFNDTYQNSLTLENVSQNAELYKRPSLLKSTEGTYDYTLTLGSSFQSKNVHMIGYVTYQNKDTGEITTIYSDRCDN